MITTGGRGVARREVAPGDDGRSERREIAVGRGVQEHDRRAEFLALALSDDLDASVPAHPLNRRDLRRRGRAYARYRAHPCEDARNGEVLRGTVAVQCGAHQQHALRAESRIERGEIAEGTQHQSRARYQHHRERHLHDDERLH